MSGQFILAAPDRTVVNENTKPKIDESNRKNLRRWILVAGFVIAFAVSIYLLRQFLSLEQLAASEIRIKEFYLNYPWTTFALAFLLYVAVTGLSLPGALMMSLLFAWFLGFLPALILISFASSTGATIAFLSSRYLLRDLFEAKFSDRLVKFNEALEKEGAFYLFTLRLIPAVPFFVINVVMGLTKMKTVTFWWVSQIGMLAGTAVFVYAGSQIPDLKTLHEKGINAVFNSEQMLKITLALGLLGVFPIAAKKIVEAISTRRKRERN